MNEVMLIGRLTKHPETRYTNAAEPVAITRFSLAVNRPFSRGQERTADFINIVAFGKQAENCERYLDKGSQVAIHGRIQTGSYKTQTGETRYTTDVVADRAEFLCGGHQAQTQKEEGIPEGFAEVSDEEVPF